MTHQYSAGNYRATVVEQRFDETNSGKTQFCLVVEIEAARVGDEYQPVENQDRRTLYRCLESDNPESEAGMIDWFRSDMNHIGYTGRRLSDLDPNAPPDRHHSFVGQQIEVRCKHEVYNGNQRERWDIARDREHKPVAKAKIERLDALFERAVDQREEAAPAKPLHTMSQADVERESGGGDDIPF